MKPRDELIVEYRGLEKTPDEKWNIGNRTAHWYEYSTKFASEYLGIGDGRSCLVIGSPVYEAMVLRERGWDVLYMDIRNPPKEVGKHIVMDATEITLPDESFDAVSTSCVLTHAGTGRYGDSTKYAHGDEIMLGHIARVMKPKAKAQITFGACYSGEKMVRLGKAHRIYTVNECERMLKEAGLSVVESKVWSFRTKTWTTEITPDIYDPDYISYAVVK